MHHTCLLYTSQTDRANALIKTLPTIENVRYLFTVEEAELSRNTGDEQVFRVHIIKNQELEKLSSLRWYDTIGMDEAYKKSCRYVEKKLVKSNESITNLLRALGRQDIRSVSYTHLDVYKRQV